MTSKPRVSVLLPVHNGAATLKGALCSVLKQTETSWECLILNDGSTDGTEEIAGRFCRRDPRMRLLGHSRKRGIVATLNEGLSASSGRWIARLDADDVCHPRRLALQADRLERKPEIDLVSCRVRLFGNEPVNEGMLEYERWLNEMSTHEEIERNFFVESPFPHPSVMTSEKAIREAGGYLDNGLPEDYDLWMRMWMNGRRFEKLSETLLYWRESPDRLSRRDPLYAPSRFRKVRLKHFIQRYPEADRRHHIWGCGRPGRKWANALVRNGRRLAGAVDISPAKFGKKLAGVEIRPLPELDFQPGDLVVCAVGVWGLRDRIRRYLTALGLTEMKDFVCVK